MRLVDRRACRDSADPQLSPDGRDVAYRQERRRLEERTHHLTSGAAGRSAADAPMQLTTDGGGTDSRPRWSPDGKTIVFIASVATTVEQIYLLPADGGEARRVDDSTPAQRPTRRGRRTASACTSSPPIAKPPMRRRRDRCKDDVYAHDEDYKQRHLWKVTRRDRRETQITSGDSSVTAYPLSDGRAQGVAFIARRHRCSASGDHGEVWVMDADGSGAGR